MVTKSDSLVSKLTTIFLASFILVITCTRAEQDNIDLETYLVFVTKPAGFELSSESEDLHNWHQSFLPNSLLSSNQRQQRVLHSYQNVISGFAAKLTAEEAKAMEEKDGFVSARPQKILQLQTTHSPDFLGLHMGVGTWNASNYGKGVIIGVLDSGITPGHPSFNDEGMPQPPAKWKGKCELQGSACNKKLIGARNFVTNEKPSLDSSSPVDKDGHGTHTASTAAGSFVQGASIYNNANGTAVGMAPLAHLAIYRVCTEEGCAESDILAAMEAAIEDGVDVLSLSIGGPSAPFFQDGTAVGAFRATQHGVFVSCSAGNSGPDTSTISNEAPWILTVGASTIDREIRATVKLGNNQQFFGESLFQPKVSVQTFWPIVYAGADGNQTSAWCGPGSLSHLDVKGKIVLCKRGGNVARTDKGVEVKNAGGVGMILMNDDINAYSTIADPHALPASHVSYSDGLAIKAYINSTSSPTAQILFEGTVLGIKTAPMASSFSSRGPNKASPGILKPDIIGPGVSILAAWPVSVDNTPNTKSTFNMVSGTSMSCPHLSGIAALLKSAHPNWTPAAIKSAIMTTADQLNLEGQAILDERLLPADVLATGAGHVNPQKAMDPGLVYDIQPDDYIPYLCGLGYTDKQIGLIVNKKVNCSQESSIPEAELNYPSFSMAFGFKTQTYNRTLTNVGPTPSLYTVEISSPPGVNVNVSPKEIEFSVAVEKATYSVTFTATGQGNNGSTTSQGYLRWFSKEHSVRSPVLVTYSD